MVHMYYFCPFSPRQLLKDAGSYKEGPDGIYGCYRHYIPRHDPSARILEHVYKNAMREMFPYSPGPIGEGL